MIATFSTCLVIAFALNSKQMSKLCGTLTEQIGKVEIEFQCSDKVTRTYDMIQNALEYENPSEKQIISLRLSSRSEDCKKSASLEFHWTGISIRLTASEHDLSNLRSDLLDIIGGTRTWYSSFARLDFVPAGSILITIVSCTYIAGMMFGWIEPVIQEYAIWNLIFLLTPFLWVCLGIILNKFWRQIFPVGDFLVGQGQQRYEDMEKVRWGIVIAFLVSLLAGFVPLLI